MAKKKITISTYWLKDAGKCSHCKDAQQPVKELQVGSVMLRLCRQCIEELKGLLQATS